MRLSEPRELAAAPQTCTACLTWQRAFSLMLTTLLSVVCTTCSRGTSSGSTCMVKTWLPHEEALLCWRMVSATALHTLRRHHRNLLQLLLYVFQHGQGAFSRGSRECCPPPMGHAEVGRMHTHTHLQVVGLRTRHDCGLDHVW
jgi:hypothetical protein